MSARGSRGEAVVLCGCASQRKGISFSLLLFLHRVRVEELDIVDDAPSTQLRAGNTYIPSHVHGFMFYFRTDLMEPRLKKRGVTLLFQSLKTPFYFFPLTRLQHAVNIHPVFFVPLIT